MNRPAENGAMLDILFPPARKKLFRTKKNCMDLNQIINN